MIFEFVDRHYKKLIIIPLVVLIASVIIIAANLVNYGSVLQRDTELVGGKMISISVNSADIEKIKAAIPEATVHITKGVSMVLVVDIPLEMDETSVFDEVRKNADVVGEPTYRTVGPVIGELFFQQTQIAIVTAFLLMAVIVFIIFRSPVPASIVVLAAVTDILSTIAIMSLLGMKLSLPVIAALMTLIGYSVDTDIVLTTNMLRGKGRGISERVKTAMKTGITMTLTALCALFALYFVSGSFVIEQIAAVLIIGLMIDVIATWLTNAGVLRYWMERKHESH